MRVKLRITLGILLVIAIGFYALRFKDISLTPRILEGAVLTIAAFVWLVFARFEVFQRQRPSARVAFLVTSILGIALVGGTMAVGLHYLDTDEVPSGEAPAVGFVPPAPAKVNRGFAAGMAIRAHRCDEPAHVTLVVAGTAEYWADNKRRLRKGGTFHLGIPATDIAHLNYGVGPNLNDVTNPVDAVPDKEAVPLSSERTRRVDGMTVISAWVPDWGSHEWPIVAHFETDWLEPRGRGNCYLRMPTLAGDNTAVATEHAAGRAKRDPFEFPCYVADRCEVMTSERNDLAVVYRPQEELLRGNLVAMAAAGGDVIAGDSVPAPDAVIEGDVAWTCNSIPRRFDRSSRSFSMVEMKQEAASDCSGFAVVAERDAGDRRDATILMMGILIAVGLGLLIESIMDWLRAEFPLKEKKDDR